MVKVNTNAQENILPLYSIKMELTQMEDLGVITPIMESTDFVYSALCPVWQYQAKENSHSDTHTHHILHYDKQSHMF